jgi:hypothetical protein
MTERKPGKNRHSVGGVGVDHDRFAREERRIANNTLGEEFARSVNDLADDAMTVISRSDVTPARWARHALARAAHTVSLFDWHNPRLDAEEGSLLVDIDLLEKKPGAEKEVARLKAYQQNMGFDLNWPIAQPDSLSEK